MKKNIQAYPKKISGITGRILVAVFLLLFTAVRGQDLTFTAKASKTQLGVNQRFRVEYSVNQSGTEDFTPPSFAHFKRIAGPSSSVSQSWINGVSSYSKTYTYILQPKSQGTFTIAPARISYKGKTYTSNALQIVVTKAVELPKDPNDPENIAGNEVFLVASVSNTHPYVGEGIYVEYRLYFSGKVRLLDVDYGDMPKYEGFWNQEIDVKTQEKTGEFQGKMFHYYTLKKAVLIPQKSGKLTIDPVSMDILLAVPTGKYDWFGSPMMRRVQKHYSSQTKRVTVKPLPETGKPSGFTGAVGDFTLSVSASKKVLNTDEATTVKVRVSGRGNLKLFDMPRLNVPPELELYEPERKQKIYPTVKGMKGSITDAYSLVPDQPGKYKIPSVSFSYFNPADGKYHTEASEEIILRVTGNGGQHSASQPIPAPARVPAGQVFQFIRTDTRLKPAIHRSFFRSAPYYWIVFIALLSVPAGIAIGRKKKKLLADTEGIKMRKQDKLARKYLSEAHKNLQNPDAFYVALEKALHLFLKSKLHLETSEMNRDNIGSLLLAKGVDNSLIAELFQLLDKCESIRYAPGGAADTQSDYITAKELIHKLNQGFKS